jgi:hypothetical protein
MSCFNLSCRLSLQTCCVFVAKTNSPAPGAVCLPQVASAGGRVRVGNWSCHRPLESAVVKLAGDGLHVIQIKTI